MPSKFAAFADTVPEALRWLVCDAMTSGGLLAALDPRRATSLPGAVVGRLVDGSPGKITVARGAGRPSDLNANPPADRRSATETPHPTL